MSAWERMDARERRTVPLEKSNVPEVPGVYALYRDGQRMYLGKATSLRTRLGQHGGRGKSMRNSTLRRTICELLGIAKASDIYQGRYATTLSDARSVTDWFTAGGAFAWVECESPAAAAELEKAMLREFKPPLNRL